MPNVVDGLRFFGDLMAIRILGKRIPIYCEWEVTDKCNMRCGFCSTLTKGRNSERDISHEEASNIIRQLSRLGTRIIHFSGGEPTLRKDLAKLVRQAKENKMMVVMTTNGSAPAGEMEKLLGIDVIRVSVDGTEDFHDSIRSTPGSFNRAIENLRFLRSRGKRPLITTTYTEDTSYAMLEDLARMARRLGVRMNLTILSRNINDTGKGFSPKKGYTAFWAEYILALKKLRKQFEDTIANPEPYLEAMQRGGLDAYGCRALDVAISIKADGSVCLPCTGFPGVRRRGDLRELFYGEEAQNLRSLQGKHPLCKMCAIRCMTSASALLKTKGLLAIADSYISDIF